MERTVIKLTERGYDGGVLLHLECGHVATVSHEEALTSLIAVYRARYGLSQPESHTVIECVKCEDERGSTARPASVLAGNVAIDARVYLESDVEAYAKLLIDAGIVVNRNKHLALVAIMNALDVHMPPEGAALLKELREIATPAGYPWANLDRKTEGVVAAE